MTLTDREYQRLRDAARAVMHEIGVETGGSNVQFAVNPEDGRVHRHRDEPARLALERARVEGDRLSDREDRRQARRRLHARRARERHHRTSAAFEPTIDYVVVKWPRFAFEKFPGADAALGTQMKSVGEVMSIGRTFPEALQKAARSLETGRDGLRQPARPRRLPARSRRAADGARPRDGRAARASKPRPTLPPPSRDELERRARRKLDRASPTADRLFYVARRAARRASPLEEVHELTAHRPLVPCADRAHRASTRAELQTRRRSTRSCLRESKRLGFCDAQIARARGRRRRTRCARCARSTASSPCTRASTPAPPSSSRTRRTSTRPTRPRARAEVSDQTQGHHPRRRPEPHRPGHRVRLLLLPRRLRAARARASRPSWSTATRRRCRPTTTPPIASTSSRSRSKTCSRSATRRRRRGELLGVIVQFGGQTPLKLAVPLEKARRASCSARPADAIDRAEDRERFDALLTKLGLDAAARGHRARASTRRVRVADEIGYPVLVRPSYVLGGRAMMICYTRARARAPTSALAVRGRATRPARRRSSIDEFLKNAIEVDVDCVCRRQARRHRRRDAAHRGGRRSLRRLDERAAAALARRRRRRRDRGADAQARARARRRRPDERAVRGQGRRGLRPRGESARVAHGAVRLQGDRAPARARSPPR